MKFKIHLKTRGCLIAVAVVVVAFVALYLSTTAFPGFGAQGAEFLRKIIGDPATAQLEMFIFSVQDSVHQVEYNLGIAKASAPWQASIPKGTPSATPLPLPSTTLTNTPRAPTPTIVQTQLTSIIAVTATRVPPTPTLTATPWSPGTANATGNLDGEGLWAPYISDTGKQVVAYRTFLQPDPKRPYTLVAIVAFDLSRIRLGFVLGTDEPKYKDSPQFKRPGTIPAADFVPGILLATFSGGFKGEHGNYGAMADGNVSIAARKGLATVAMYKDGSVKIGEYGKDLTASDQMVAWRQNCSLVIQDGKINPLVNVDSAEYWGANLNGATVTWRSGIGISADGNTLYYFAGPSMTAIVLADAMMAAHVQSGMQLDINNFWVHFTAIRVDTGKMVADPLFPSDMFSSVDRYLKPYARDYFYIALKSP